MHSVPYLLPVVFSPKKMQPSYATLHIKPTRLWMCFAELQLKIERGRELKVDLQQN